MEQVSRKYFNDFIFINQHNRLKIIVPTGDTDWVRNNILIPTFGEEFSIKDDDTILFHWILFMWLVFTVKKRMRGNL